MKLIIQNTQVEEILETDCISISQKGDSLQILNGHTDIIYAISNGVLKFNEREINVKSGILRVINGECRILI